MATNIREATLEFIDGVQTHFVTDLDALTDEQVMRTPGGLARRAIDYVYECALIHDLINCRLEGTNPKSLFAEVVRDTNGFIVAPEGYTPALGKEYFVRSIEQIKTHVREASDEKLLSIIKTSSGEEPFYSLAMFAASHSNYHNGQLAQLQGFHGDGSNHWF
jgi:hypothetical protein